MRDIGFAANLVPLIRSGDKRLTYRLGGWHAEPGERLMVRNSSTGEAGPVITVTETAAGRFGDLPLWTDGGHEPYESREQMRQVFEGYYGRPVAGDEPVTVVLFTAEP